MKILQTPLFAKQIKKMHKNQKQILDDVILEISKNPVIGDMKKGDLSGVIVYKFKMLSQLMLLAYKYEHEELKILLLSIGTHENFYRDLKNYCN